MKLNKYLLAVPVGLALSVATSFAVDPCISQMVPCEGPQVVNGFGCSTGCPPTFPNDGCCSYTEYRVNCDSGPDQFYRVRGCQMLHYCGDPTGMKLYQCHIL